MQVLIQNFSYISWQMLVMLAIGGGLIYLAIAKQMDFSLDDTDSITKTSVNTSNNFLYSIFFTKKSFSSCKFSQIDVYLFRISAKKRGISHGTDHRS